MVLKMSKKVFLDFFNKVKMQGTEQLNEAIFDFAADGLKIVCNSPTQHARVSGHLFSKSFTEYEAYGKIGLNDLEKLYKVIDRFDETITMKKEGNLLTISDNKNKSVGIELVAEGFLSTEMTEPKLEFTENFSLSIDALHSAFDDVLLNKDAAITFSTSPNVVIIDNTGKYKFKNIFNIEGIKGGVKCSFGLPLINCLNNLNGTLQISLSSDYPMKVVETTGKSVISIIVAPRIEDA